MKPALESLTFMLLPQTLRLCGLTKEDRPACAHALLKTLFFREEETTFLSFTETEDEISLLLPNNVLSFYSNANLSKFGRWNVIERFKKKSLNEVGVISSLSTPIAQAKVSMLYISTFSSAFIMVEEQNKEKTIQCLHEHKPKFNVIPKLTKQIESNESDHPKQTE
eukprot:TRINITY_DN3447_c0_g1_i2.p1 TRINITY_DN3447_c0_g1~~TRINITY_DN3447_c0_g1_i2.p1  ORF type:complete len:166 (+),score=14.95 TRINITY_DN3447_c0_g1_i2:282-779(+)